MENKTNENEMNETIGKKLNLGNRVKEIESEVHVTENFSTWTLKERADLLQTIINGGNWDFSDRVTVEYDPPLVYQSGTPE